MNQGPSVPSRNSFRKWRGIVVQSLISVSLITVGIVGFWSLGRGRSPQRLDRQEPDKPAVEVVAVGNHDRGIDFSVDGVVVPFRQIEVPAEVSGRISLKSENCRIGRMVKQGELLIRIDPRDYELEIRRLKEDVRQARANLRELEVETDARTRQIELAREDLAIKQREVERYDRIEDPGVYSKSELDATRLKELQARDAVQTEQDQLNLLQARHERLASEIDLGIARLEKAQLDLERTKIFAPIDGVITTEGPEQGAYVAVGGTVASIQDTSRMDVRCSLHMRQMNWLWNRSPSTDPSVDARNGYQLPETPATVIFQVGEAEYRWNGQLDYFDGAQVDQQTRMVPCRVSVRNPRQVTFQRDESSVGRTASMTLMAGMFVTVQVHAKPQISLLKFPEAAIQPGNHVWIVRPDATSDPGLGRLHRCDIRVAQATLDGVLAYARQSDLQAGDMIVVSPLASPTQGAVVEILETP